ncbi:MAG: hypothetical protein WCT33_01110 [Patescibacteria group bacterium]
MPIKKYYYAGDKAPETGEYLCMPCGYKSKLEKGEKFPECVSCLIPQKKVDIDEVADDATWEKVG